MNIIVRLLRMVFGALTLLAIGRQLVIHLQLDYDVVNFFSFFTNLSNLFAACIFLLGVRDSTALISAESLDELRVMAATNMVVVGIVPAAGV